MTCCRSEGSVVSATLHRATSEPDGTRGTVGPVHRRGCRGPGADDRLAEGRPDAAGDRGRSVPYRDGRRPVVASHRRRQA